MITPLPRPWLSALVWWVAVTAAAADTTPHMLLLDGVRVGGDIIAVGERGSILRTADSAQTWTAAPSPSAATLTGVSFAPDAQHGWVVGHDALILATQDGGHTWQKQWQGENLSDSLLDVLALDKNRVIAIGAFGLCLVTDDGGRTWGQRQLLDNDYHLNRITRGPTGTLYLAGEHGTLLRSTDAGGSWTAIDSPYDGSFYGILPLADRTLLAYGLRGRLYRSTDDGDNWQPVSNDQRVLLATALQLSDGTIVLAGQARFYFTSHDHGKSLEAWTPALQAAVAELIETPAGTVLALGEAGATVLAKP
ncbi:MAG: hypothetical protein KBF26_10425 [Opitutaceae bacterium]|nr:hypothetical protein [Opitutaceae bacterium]